MGVGGGRRSWASEASVRCCERQRSGLGIPLAQALDPPPHSLAFDSVDRACRVGVCHRGRLKSVLGSSALFHRWGDVSSQRDSTSGNRQARESVDARWDVTCLSLGMVVIMLWVISL